MSLYKGHGSGNDFLVGLGDEAVALATDEALVRRLCDRHRGLGADGTLALFAEEAGRLRLIYRNADGGRASFCANGSRLAALIAHRIAGLPTEQRLNTDAGEVRAVVEGSSVRLELDAEAGTSCEIEVDVAGHRFGAHHLVVGVPHLVIAVDDPQWLEAFDLASVEALRRLPELGSEGANVHLVARRDDARLLLRSLERGIDGETLSCGSGAMAVGLLEARPVDIVVRSGDILTVEPGPPLRLTGPAEIVAKVEWLG